MSDHEPLGPDPSFARELESESGIPFPHPLESGCFVIFGMGILFGILFLISFLIHPTVSGAVLVSVVVVTTLVSRLIRKNVIRRVHFRPEGLVIETSRFGKTTREVVPNSEVREVTGKGESTGGRTARIRYFVLINLKSGKVIKPEFREYTFEEINRNVAELARRLDSSWIASEEYHYDPD